MKLNYGAALIGVIIPLYSAVRSLPVNKTPPNPGFTNIAVSCYGNDAVGARLCFAVREKLRSSRAFQVVDECQTKMLCIRLITIDVNKGVEGMQEGCESTASAVMTAGPFYLLEHTLYTVGGDRVDSQAEDIVVTAEKALIEFDSNW